MGLRLFFWPKFPRATFIQGGVFIPDSRVSNKNFEINFYFTLTRYVNVLMSHVRFPMMSHHQLVELLLHPVSKSHTNMIVEKIREGLRFHKGEEEIGPTIDNRIYTPRLYTTEKFCASLSVDHFYELPSYHCRSLLFSSQRLACPHLSS